MCCAFAGLDHILNGLRRDISTYRHSVTRLPCNRIQTTQQSDRHTFNTNWNCSKATPSLTLGVLYVLLRAPSAPRAYKIPRNEWEY